MQTSLPRKDLPKAVLGEVVLELSEEGLQSCQRKYDLNDYGRSADETPVQLGLDDVDERLGDLGAERIETVGDPVPSQLEEAANEKPSAFFRARFDSQAQIEDAVALLKGPSRYVRSVTPNYLRFAQQDLEGARSASMFEALAAVNLPAARERRFGRPEVPVAVIDTGVDLDHPYLPESLDLSRGYDFVSNIRGTRLPGGYRWLGDEEPGRDPTPADDDGHGTHVTGIIGGRIVPSQGFAGVASSCSLIPVRALARLEHETSPGKTLASGTAADIAAAIEWASRRGAMVINMSFGFPNPSPAERNMVRRALERGAVLIAAAGNKDRPTDRPRRIYPAAYGSAILGISSVTLDGRPDPRSQTGNHVAMSAPGVGIESLAMGGGIRASSGTSMSSAFVAGAAAALRSIRPAWPPKLVARVLLGSARRFDSDRRIVGEGMLDIGRALSVAVDS